MRRASWDERDGGRRIDAPAEPLPKRRSYKVAVLGAVAAALAGLVFYPFMPALGSAAFFLGRTGRSAPEASSSYRFVATAAMVVGALELAAVLVVTLVVLAIFFFG